MKQTLTAVFLFCTIACFSQTTVNKGRIILADKTLTGFIRTIAAEPTSQNFSFSETEHGNFNPVAGDIIRVEYDNGTILEKYTVTTAVISRDYMHRAEGDYNQFSTTSPRFLQIVLTGKYNLYLFKDEYAFEHFFYTTATEKHPVLLVNRSYADQYGNFKDDNAFRNQISFLFQKEDCRLTENDKKNISYDLTSMLIAFKKLNGCSGNKSVDHYRKQNRNIFLPGIVAGVNNNIVTPDVSSPGWDRQMLPVGGAYVLFEPGRGKRGFGFGCDILYSSFKMESDYRKPSTTYAGFKAYYEASEVAISPFLRLYVAGNKIRTYVSGGIHFPVSIKTSYQLRNDAGTVYTFGSNTSSVYPVLALGINYSRLSAEFNAASNFNSKKPANQYGLMLRFSVLNLH